MTSLRLDSYNNNWVYSQLSIVSILRQLLAEGEVPLPPIDPDQELEEETTESGRPPRRRSLLLLGMVVCLGIAIGLAVLFFLPNPKKKEIVNRQEASGQQSVPNEPTAPGQMLASEETGEPAAAQPASMPQTVPTPEGTSSAPESDRLPVMPVVDLPTDEDPLDLEGVDVPPLPYCIYTGAHKDYQEAATTESELDSNYLPAYIVPIEIKGNVAQSLFGVTQDGLWYRVMTGHFSSKEEARKTLGMMMQELPGYQPEIMRFPYALECGRFLVPEEARALSEKLDQKDVFNYTQTYPTSHGRSLSRVLVGCFFSQQGAEEQGRHLQEVGFSCTVAER